MISLLKSILSVFKTSKPDEEYNPYPIRYSSLSQYEIDRLNELGTRLDDSIELDGYSARILGKTYLKY